MPIYKDPKSPIDGIPSYFFNNTYDVNTVRKNINKYYHQLYFSCLRAQRIACKLGFISGSMKDFKIDHDLNSTCGFPATTYSTSIQNTFLNYFYERPVLLEPVLVNRMTPITETFKDSERYHAGLLFFIGDQLFSKMYLIPCKEYTFLVIFPNDNGLPEATIKEMVMNNVDWKIYVQKPSNFYVHNAARPSTCFNVSEGGIPLSIFTGSDLDGCNKTLNDNAYFAFISDPEAVNRNLMKMTLSHKITGTDGGQYFQLEKSYISSLVSGSRAIDIYIVGTRDMDFRGSLGQTRYFQIPLENGKNPVPVDNLRYYAYNANTGVMSPRPDVITTLYYPNVYSIENAGDDNLVVDVYYSNEVSTTFINPIENYMKYLEEDGADYALQCINDTLEDPIKDYMPEKIRYCIKDYLQYAEAMGSDARWEPNIPDRYSLDKLVDILKDDVNRYTGFFKDIVLDTNHDVFDFDVSLAEYPDIYNNTVTENHSPIDTLKVTFEEPMMWFRFYEKSEEKFPMEIFVDGKIIGKLTTFKYGHDVYAYIPKSLANANSILHFCIMTQNAETRFSIKNPINFTQLYQEITFPANFKHFSDRNLLYYDADTMVRYPNSYFRLKAYFGLESAFLQTKSEEYVLTNADDFILTGNVIATSLSSGLSYKEIGTRVAEFYFNMTDSTIYQNAVTTNEDIVNDPKQVRTFAEPMIYFSVEAPDTGYLYPIRVKIDDDYTDQVFRYTVINEEGLTLQYIFIPQSLVSATSDITVDLMIAPTEEVLKSQLSYEIIPQIRIQVTNEEAVGKNIIIKSIDEYHSAIWDTQNDDANAAYWIIEPTGTITTNIDPDAESVYVEDTYTEGRPPEQYSDNTTTRVYSTSGRIRRVSPRVGDEDTPTYSNQFTWSEFDLEPSKDRIRIWHCNKDTGLGTLIDPSAYMVQSNPRVIDSLIITSNFDMDNGDYYLVEYLPWRYTKVKDINRNNPMDPTASDTLVDLSELDRPVDGTYEYFLDGVRLDHNMARFVSPTKFLFINENTSHFTIYERSHDVDVYGNINMKEKSLEDQLMDVDSDFLEYMKTKALQN